MSHIKISNSSNIAPQGADKIPIARAGSSVAYHVTVSDLRSAVIDAHAYGAVGDGTTDDGAAINQALAATNAAGYGATRAGKIVIKLRPGKTYKITSPLNMCEMQGVVLDGGAPNFGATLLGQTDGAAMIEIIGSQDITIQNLNIYGNSTLTPAVGVFTSRSNTVHGANSANISYTNVQFGGYFIQTPVYIVESETNYFSRCNWYTTGGTMTTGALLCRANELSLTPVHATLKGAGNGLWNINFDRCAITSAIDARCIHIHDGVGDVYIHDSYLFSSTVPTIEIEGGARLYVDHVGCEGSPNYTIYFNYDAGAAGNTSYLFLNSFNFGAPTSHSIYVDDGVTLKNSRIEASPPGVYGGAAMPVRLYKSEGCDFTGLADYRSGVFDILYDSAAGYSVYCKYRLMTNDTLTFSGGAYSSGDIVENMVAAAGEYLQVPSLRAGSSAGRILGVLTATDTWNPASLNDGQTEAKLVAVSGVAVDGNWVAWASLSTIDTGAWAVSAYPVGGGIVAVITNHTGAPVNLASGTLRVVAMKVA